MTNGTNLTNAKLESLKPPKSGQMELSDSKVPGLRIRVGKGGTKSFILRKRVGGKVKNITIGRYGPRLGLAEARKRARSIISDIEAGGVPKPIRKSGGVTIRNLWPHFEAEKSCLRSIAEIRRIFERNILPALGDRLADSVTRSEITEFIDSIERPVMARAVLAQLSAFYSWAMPRLDKLESNPCRDAGKPPRPKPRQRTLTDSELRALWLALDDEKLPWQQSIKLLTLTGQRRNEVFAADRKEFDLEAGIWTIPAERAKNGETHLVPLSSLAVAVIRSIPIKEASPKLFPSRTTPANGPSGFSRTIARLRSAVDVELDRETSEKWTLHDIRRTVATGLQRLGVRLEVTEAVLNHRSGSKGGIAGVYQTHDWADEKRTALDAWAVEVERIVARRETSNVVQLERLA